MWPIIHSVIRSVLIHNGLRHGAVLIQISLSSYYTFLLPVRLVINQPPFIRAVAVGEDVAVELTGTVAVAVTVVPVSRGNIFSLVVISHVYNLCICLVHSL